DEGTSHCAGRFWVEAERKGVAPPSGLKIAWLAHARREARDWAPRTQDGWNPGSDQLAQAYRLYVLALANTAEAGAMNRLRTTPGLGHQARWMLAAAFALNNRKDVAREPVKTLTTSAAPRRAMAWTHGSDRRGEGRPAGARV